MPSRNNSKIISDAHPHTIKKFDMIETYIKSWAQILMLNKSSTGIVFIDCMCNSGVYRDDNDDAKIEELKKHLPEDERNFKIVTTVRDGNELLKYLK